MEREEIVGYVTPKTFKNGNGEDITYGKITIVYRGVMFDVFPREHDKKLFNLIFRGVVHGKE